MKDKGNGEVAAVRIKARYQSVQILPMQAYTDLLTFIKQYYLSVCRVLEPALSVKAKEDLATVLVRIMHKLHMAKHFLCDLIMSEVDVLDNEHLMFRGNSLATKAMEAYMKLVADDYLQNTLGEFVKAMQQFDKDCEVDPLKMANISVIALEKNRHQLVTNVKTAWSKILARLHAYNNNAKLPTHIRNTVSESHVITKGSPATHLNTNDDYVLDIALLNDSLAVRQAGLTVQKHRNGHHRNQRYLNENASCERHNKRNPYMALPDISSNRERIIAFDASSKSVAPENSTYISSNILSDYSTGGYRRNEETDSDETTHESSITRFRHTRPPRKNKRRTAVSTDREQTTVTCPDTIVAPSSSGYQSQNHSSSLSSSNSSSPVERSTKQNNHPTYHSTLQPSNPIFNGHECNPSTSSSSGNSDKLLVDDDRRCIRSAPSTMYKTSAHPSHLQIMDDNSIIYDVPKCSLPRTNPHCSSRNAAAMGNGAILKPTLIDIGNDGGNEARLTLQARSSDYANCNNNNNSKKKKKEENDDGNNDNESNDNDCDDNNTVKECGTKWCFTEERTSGMKQWTRKESHTFSQQEIIEQQKREIRRLMKENEELKRRVAAQNQTVSDSKNTNPETVIRDGYVSEESYDSLSSSNDLQLSSKNTKAITHC
uniref:Bm7585 n=1 Tax=Brugia malayi TaxID=6279 RepID=A0A1I9GCZ6_BRUMA|nr:Bm7585 [Brugia malayi]